MNKRAIIFLKEILVHPLVLSIFGGLIVGVIGVCLTDRFAQKNLEKQMQLELYKDLIHQQSEFVDHLTKDIYGRTYKLATYIANLRSGDREKAREFRAKCKDAAVEWSEELMLYLINLDRYFPKAEFTIGKYARATDLFKEHLEYSFRQVLERDIQPRFYYINNTLGEFDTISVVDDKNKKDKIQALEKEVDKLYKRVYELNEALSRASTYYKISTKTRLIKENF